jgi:hypothetical protein
MPSSSWVAATPFAFRSERCRDGAAAAALPLSYL